MFEVGFVRVVFDFDLWSFPSLFFFAFLLEFVKCFFGVEDEEDAFEYFVADVIRVSLGGVFAVELGALLVGLVHLCGCLLKHLIFRFGLEDVLLAVFVNAVIDVFRVLAFESLL